MLKTLGLLLIGIVIGAVGLYAYQNPEFRSQTAEFLTGLVNSTSDSPDPAPSHTPTRSLVMAVSPTVIPTPDTPVGAVPTSTAKPQPFRTPDSAPTVTAELVPSPTPVPATYTVKVVSVESLGGESADFFLEVRNAGELESDEVALVEMSIDGGAPELVNIIGSLSAGESNSFVFTRKLSPGPRTLRFTVGDSAVVVSVNVEGDSAIPHTPTPPPAIIPTPEPTVTVTIVPTPIPIPTETAIPTSTPTPTITPLPTNTAVPTETPIPTPTPESALSPDLRHLEEKRYMLELINGERTKAGLATVVLGNNVAVQLHAEAALENCFTGHWGIDGLKPYTRYSLAGGYQSNGENGLGNRYCIRSEDGFRPIGGIEQEIRDGVQSWMDSSGHRRNILGKLHKKVNIGLAWDKYNIAFYQHFEGDYLEYEQLPTIENKTLYISGTTKNGVKFAQDRDLGLQLYYDPPPRPLTSGQLSKTYCYDSGRPITAFRPPLTGDYYYTEHRFIKSYQRCTDPYDFPADTPAPKPPRGFFQLPEVPPVPPLPTMLDLPWTTAAEWRTNGVEFSFRANLSNLLSKYGEGVYTVMVWAKLDQQDVVISQYSIFYGVEPPDTYGQ